MSDMTKSTTIEMVEGEVVRVSGIYEKVKTDLIEKTDGILKQNKKSISNIKNTCSNFFDKYDHGLQFVEKRFDNIFETFTNFEKTTIQPVTVREARMYHIECKIKEFEDVNVHEVESLRTLITKLLFALDRAVNRNNSVELAKLIHKHKPSGDGLATDGKGHLRYA
jgi:phage-related tail protein